MLLSNLELLATAPGGVAKLRELILTLAVQGKLVPQDPADEPASRLLKKIWAEKDRLIAEGKIKRDKPLAEIAEEEKPFELPVGWKWVRLGTLTNISTGKLDANAAVTDGQYPFFTCSNTPLSIDKFSFDCHAVLLAGNGDFNLKHYTGKFDAYQRTYVIEPILLDLKFLYYTLKKYIGELTKNQRGSAIPYLKLGDITNPLIPLPPLAEQSRIVTRVEDLMRLCDALEAKGQLEAAQHAQLVSTLLGALTASTTPEELAENWQRVAQHFDLLLDRPEAIDALEQTVLQLAVRGLLVPQDPTDEPASVLLHRVRAEKDRLIAAGQIKRDKPLPPITDEEKPFELSKGWEWVRLREVVTHLGDGLHGTPQYSSTGEYYFVNGNNLRDGAIVIKPETKRVDKSEFEKYKKPLDATTVLLSINGTLGNVAFYGGEKVILGKSACYFNLTSGLAKSFVRTLLECPDFQDYALTSATGSTIKNLGLKAIGDWPIALPPLAEQSRIVTRISALRSLCADLRHRLAERQSVQARLAEALVQEVA